MNASPFDLPDTQTAAEQTDSMEKVRKQSGELEVRTGSRLPFFFFSPSSGDVQW